VCPFDFKITCLMETWLCESFPVKFLFPETYTVYCSDTDCNTKLRDNGALIAVSDAVFGR
jgi:hypothetical protein